jgi:hypothetical protein
MMFSFDVVYGGIIDFDSQTDQRLRGLTYMS